MKAGDSDGLMSEINVTPFVDVMLVLLIIFMVTAPMMVQGLNVDLPKAEGDALPSDKQPLVISITPQHQIFINDFQVGLDFLRDKLIKVLENRTDRDVYLKADQSIAYGMVVRVMSEIRAAGVTSLGMVTEPPQTDTAKKGLKK